MKKILLIALLSICQLMFSQERGTIKGKVTDKEMGGEPLPFANVLIKGTSIGSTSDIDGNFTINAPVGNQTIVFSFVGYETVEKNVNVVAGKTTTVNQELGANQGVALEEVEIKGSVNKEGKSALLLEQKKATVIKESIGAEELSKKGVSDAAAAVAKISGVSKQEGSSNVYVRGLGDRYLNTTMNGLTLPSNDIEKKNIDLSLFPSDIIQNVSISKAYSPEFYGDFAAGNVDITSKEYRGKGFFDITASTGINTRAIKKEFVQSSGVGYFGYYGRYKHHPFAVSLGTNTDPVQAGAPVNSSIGITGGKSFDFKDESRLSLFGTASFQNGYEYREGPIVDYTNDINKNFQRSREYRYSTLTNIMLNALYRMNDNNSLKFTSLFLNNSSDKVGEYGYDGNGKYVDAGRDKGYFVKNIQFNQDLIFVNQLTGLHKFLEGKHKLSWGVGYNRVFAHEPNRKRITLVGYDYLFDNDPTTNPTFFDINAFQNQRYFQRIRDEELNSRINFAWEKSENVTFNIGYNGRLKLRNFDNVRYGFDFKNNQEVKDINNLNQYFSASRIGDGGKLDSNARGIYNLVTSKPISYTDKNGVVTNYSNTNMPGLPENTYKGEMNIHAGYISAIIKAGENWSFVPGVRLESFKQEIGYDVLNLPIGYPKFVKSDETFVLPSLNVKYALSENQNIRFSFSKTVSIPEFKEIAPFVYIGVSKRVGGNPDLARKISHSKAYNLDLKYEWFISRDELLSITAFGKQITDPINLVFGENISGNQIFIRTGDKAEVYGAELELKKNLMSNEDEETQLSGGLNISYMYTKQDLKTVTGYEGVSFDRNEDELQGASPLLINANIDYSPTHYNNYKPILSLVYSYFSDRINALGSGDAGNIVDKSFSSLDFIWKNKLGENIEINFSAKNLLDPSITQLRENTAQGDLILSEYKRGTNLGLGFKYKF